MRRLALPLCAVVALAATSAPARPQSPPRKPITQETYDLWRSIQGSTISPNGNWAAYTVTPVVGDGDVVLRATTGSSEFRFPRGWTGRPVMSVTQDSGFSAPPAQFSADSKVLAFLAYAPKADFDKARREKKKPADQPKASLVLVTTASGKAETIARVKSFRLARESGRWIAWLLEAPDTSGKAGAGKDSATAKPAMLPPAVAGAAAPGPSAAATDSAKAGAKEKKKDTGTTLVLRDLSSGAETRIDDVLAYAFDDSAKWLAYTVSSKTKTRDGAYARSLTGTIAGAEVALATGNGNYKALTLDRAGTQIAFVSDRDEYAKPQSRYTLYYAALGASPAAQAIAAPGAFGDSLNVSDKGRVAFVRDGSALVFGVAPVMPDTIPADSLADKAVYDLWNYKDSRLQPQQKLELARDRDRSFTAVWTVKQKTAVVLGNDSLRDVSVSDNGRVALAGNELPYAIQAMWGEGGADAILLDAATGKRTLVAQKLEFDAALSPAAKYMVYFDKGHWSSYAIASGKTTDLTSALKSVHFEQENWDIPSNPAPWGVAAWTTDDRSVLLYSRYDVWEVDPTGVRPARVITDSVGVRGHIQLRYVRLDPDERALDPNATILLSAFDDNSKAAGFYRDQLGVTRAPERIVMADFRFGNPTKARRADRFLVTRQTFRDFPNLWTGPRLDSLVMISDANPQQGDYRWATAELVHWRSTDGEELQGILYKPDDFDPSKKYPLIAYFYEQLSDNLHQYSAPTGRNVINPVVYASHGYLVFFPDIYYFKGYPGPSALKSIVPGIQSLIDRGFVDAKAIGTAGQSWGGYQTAYMITQTNLFAAAFAGAPVANMTSAYGGIRWGSGLARAFQYEHSQSRIGGSIWEYPIRFIENSPLFFVDRIQTPVLIMSNDADDAVPWYQGIEFFVALRRFGKEAYLVSYNGDVHNPRKRANQKDVDLKMQQFFDHHLRGAPAPDWMTKGIPAIAKGRDQMQKGVATGSQTPSSVPSSGTPKQP
jgi:dipeptidyl aminopeptidase/acylaminoacyl peptidase